MQLIFLTLNSAFALNLTWRNKPGSSRQERSNNIKSLTFSWTYFCCEEQVQEHKNTHTQSVPSLSHILPWRLVNATQAHSNVLHAPFS